MRTLAIVCGAAALWGLLAAAPANAQPLAAPEVVPGTAPLWELGIGVGALRLPHYRGSDQAHSWLLPVPYVVYRGNFFKADREGTRAVLFNSERVDFDLSLSASAPTRSSDNRARSGMPDLAPTLEFGPNLNLTLGRGSDWKFDLRLPVRAVVTLERHVHSAGVSAAPNLNLDLRLSGSLSEWNLGLQGGPLFGDRRRHAYFYDVDPAYATATRPAYAAQAGFAGWAATLALSKRTDSGWTGLYVRGDSLAGARFEGSPLVKSRSNWSAGIAMAWVLKSSEQRVPAGN
jgi:outer membrane scaffolding protein for murein synthesis (MipA/OmpV family)